MKKFKLVGGVFCFYAKTRIDHNLQEKFIDRVLANSLRSKYYGKNFLLTSGFYDDVEKSMRLLMNRNKNYFLIYNWLENLTTGSAQSRRDDYFAEVHLPPGSSTWKNETI